AVIHRKSVVVFEYWDDVFCAGFLKKTGPCGRIKFLSLEFRDEVLVSKLVLWPINSEVVLVLIGSLQVHIAGIPLVAKSRNGIDAPVNENPKLGVLIPIRDLIRLKGLPIRAERTDADGLVDSSQDGGSCRVVFRAGLPPVLIDGDGVHGNGRSVSIFGLG